MDRSSAAGGGHPLVLTLYHPRFHQIPENDGWYGPGFTEWGLVAGASPRYPGHRQPQLPGELGFYDQRVPQTRSAQARLAAHYGISGFLYLHYRFGGHELFQQPLAEVLASGSPSFPFALCWANESWPRVRDAGSGELLLAQPEEEADEADEADEVAHIRSLTEYFKDPRYIRVHGRPLFVVSSPHLLADPERMVGRWKSECKRAGTEPPWLVMYEGDDGVADPTKLGFDASVEALPQFTPAGSKDVTVIPYSDVVSSALSRTTPSWRRYPSVAPGWDSTPVHPAGGAVVWKDSTPARYGQWLAAALDRQEGSEGADGIVVIDAWNDWAHGNHLEPDTHWGRAYLNATREVVASVTGTEPGSSAAGMDGPVPAPTTIEDLYAELSDRYAGLQASTSGLLSHAERRLHSARQQFDATLGELRAESNRLVEILTPMEDRLAMERERADALERLLSGRPPVPAVVRSVSDDASAPAGPARYFELLKACLTRMLFMNDEPGRDLRALAEQREIRTIGKDWPEEGETMIGMLRLDCLQECVETVLREQVPGDFLEAGVWRGGATILMKGILAAYGDHERQVWVADSFRGLPVPDEVNFPQDVPIDQSIFEELAVSLEQVKANFARYDLLDDRVRFLEGWFKDTLPTAPVGALAVLRLDGDYYESTIQILESLYHKVSPGGFVVVDDYGCIDACRQAVTDFRTANGIEDAIVPVDWTGIYWRRSA